MDGNKKDDRIEERVELSILYDFYGALLKENQQRMFEACILEDYNFTEIAQEEGISRQGVYDSIRRSTKQLREYEERLGLLEQLEKQKKLAKKIHQQLQELPLEKENNHLEKINEMLQEILEE